MSNKDNAEKNHNNKYDFNNNKIFGFWIYIMNDCILFATMFAVYITLSNQEMYYLLKKNIFNLPFVFIETMLLLLSSLIYGKSTQNLQNKYKKKVIYGLILTATLGTIFIGMEIYEFKNLINNKFYPTQNAFLSSFFTIISMHGIHIFVGIIWIILMIYKIINNNGFDQNIQTGLRCLSIFWHFLDIIWIYIFNVIYLIGII